MEKAIYDCGAGTATVVELTSAEITEHKAELQAAEEQSVLDSLLPSDKEILMAEIEIQTIEILMEGGLL